MDLKEEELEGLSFEEVAASRKKYGLNKLDHKKQNNFYLFLKVFFQNQ